MQLVEGGKLALDGDVNQYLDFKIPEAFGKPVTIRNLLTHTAGFEDRFVGMWTDDPKELTPVDVFLKTHIPLRIYPPGQQAAYSNYGVTLPRLHRSTRLG